MAFAFVFAIFFSQTTQAQNATTTTRDPNLMYNTVQYLVWNHTLCNCTYLDYRVIAFLNDNNPPADYYVNIRVIPNEFYDLSTMDNYQNPVIIVEDQYNHQTSYYVNVKQCWANTTSFDKIWCPIISVHVSPSDDHVMVYFSWNSTEPSKPEMNYAIETLGYSTTLINQEQYVSPTLQGIATQFYDFIKLNVDIWRIVFYLFEIVVIIFAVFGIPLMVFTLFKWAITQVKKMGQG